VVSVENGATILVVPDGASEPVHPGEPTALETADLVESRPPRARDVPMGMTG
jgi:hypothetical protein